MPWPPPTHKVASPVAAPRSATMCNRATTILAHWLLGMAQGDGATFQVHCEGGHGDGHASGQGGLSGRVDPRASLHGLAHDDFVDLRSRYSCPPHRCAQHGSPSWVAGSSASVPPSLPIAVLTAPAMTTSRIVLTSLPCQ